MIPNKPDERREHLRIDSALPLRIKTKEFDITTSTQNISCIGAYCKIDRYLDPMTKLNIDMVLNNQNNASSKAPNQRGVKVKCKGVVVRTEPQDNHYNIAIFFNDIHQNEKNKINKFIKNLLSF